MHTNNNGAVFQETFVQDKYTLIEDKFGPLRIRNVPTNGELNRGPDRVSGRGPDGVPISVPGKVPNRGIKRGYDGQGQV